MSNLHHALAARRLDGGRLTLVSRSRLAVIAGVVVVFLVAGGYLALRGSGGGGQTVTIDLKVTGSTMTPENPTARANDSVTLTITADRDEEIHLHGYDIAFECRAGQPLTKTFRADKTGAFDIEIEDPPTPLGKLTVNA